MLLDCEIMLIKNSEGLWLSSPEEYQQFKEYLKLVCPEHILVINYWNSGATGFDPRRTNSPVGEIETMRLIKEWNKIFQ